MMSIAIAAQVHTPCMWTRGAEYITIELGTVRDRDDPDKQGWGNWKVLLFAF